MLIEVVSGTENKHKLILSSDGVVINHTLILGAELRDKYGVTIADSDVDASLWDFTNAAFMTVKIGLSGVVKGTHNTKLIIKDSLHSTGLVWNNADINIKVLP